MTRLTRILLGVGTVWLPVYVVIVIASMIGFVLSTDGDLSSSDHTPFLALFGGLLLLHVLTIALTLGLQIFFIVNTFRNPDLPEERRLMWAFLIGFLGALTMPVYWYLYIWKPYRELPAYQA